MRPPNLEMMRVVYGHAEEADAIAQNLIPHLLQALIGPSTRIVGMGVAVENFKVFEVAQRREIAGGQRPAEVRVIDARYAAGRVNGVHLGLKKPGFARGGGNLDAVLSVHAVGMNGDFVET